MSLTPSGQLSTTGVLATSNGQYPLLAISIEEQMKQDATLSSSFWSHQGFVPWVARNPQAQKAIHHLLNEETEEQNTNTTNSIPSISSPRNSMSRRSNQRNKATSEDTIVILSPGRNVSPSIRMMDSPPPSRGSLLDHQYLTSSPAHILDASQRVRSPIATKRVGSPLCSPTGCASPTLSNKGGRVRTPTSINSPVRALRAGTDPGASANTLPSPRAVANLNQILEGLVKGLPPSNSLPNSRPGSVYRQGRVLAAVDTVARETEAARVAAKKPKAADSDAASGGVDSLPSPKSPKMSPRTQLDSLTALRKASPSPQTIADWDLLLEPNRTRMMKQLDSVTQLLKLPPGSVTHTVTRTCRTAPEGAGRMVAQQTHAAGSSRPMQVSSSQLDFDVDVLPCLQSVLGKPEALKMGAASSLPQWHTNVNTTQSMHTIKTVSSVPQALPCATTQTRQLQPRGSLEELAGLSCDSRVPHGTAWPEGRTHDVPDPAVRPTDMLQGTNDGSAAHKVHRQQNSCLLHIEPSPPTQPNVSDTAAKLLAVLADSGACAPHPEQLMPPLLHDSIDLTDRVPKHSGIHGVVSGSAPSQELRPQQSATRLPVEASFAHLVPSELLPEASCDSMRMVVDASPNLAESNISSQPVNAVAPPVDATNTITSMLEPALPDGLQAEDVTSLAAGTSRRYNRASSLQCSQGPTAATNMQGARRARSMHRRRNAEDELLQGDGGISHQHLLYPDLDPLAQTRSTLRSAGSDDAGYNDACVDTLQSWRSASLKKTASHSREQHAADTMDHITQSAHSRSGQFESETALDLSHLPEHQPAELSNSPDTVHTDVQHVQSRSTGSAHEEYQQPSNTSQWQAERAHQHQADEFIPYEGDGEERASTDSRGSASHPVRTSGISYTLVRSVMGAPLPSLNEVHESTRHQELQALDDDLSNRSSRIAAMEARRAARALQRIADDTTAVVGALPTGQSQEATVTLLKTAHASRSLAGKLNPEPRPSSEPVVSRAPSKPAPKKTQALPNYRHIKATTDIGPASMQDIWT